MMISRIVGVAMIAAAVGCSRQPPIDKIAVGQDVTLTRADGGVVEGKVASLDDTTVRLTKGQTSKSVAKNQIVDVKVADGTTPVELPRAATFHEYTVPQGTPLSLKLATAIDSSTSHVEDRVEATLAEPVSVKGVQVLPAGSVLRGVVADVAPSGKVKGRARISLRFTRVVPAGQDEAYDINATYAETAEPTKDEDAVKIGIGAGAGAAIGGLLGGKGGAAKGAAIGGGAGTAAVLSTKGEDIERPAGSQLIARLKASVDIRVPIR